MPYGRWLRRVAASLTGLTAVLTVAGAALAYGPSANVTNSNWRASEAELQFRAVPAIPKAASDWNHRPREAEAIPASAVGVQEQQGTPADDEVAAQSNEPVVINPALMPPELRPPDWPVLPHEGGADGYAEIDPLEGINRVFFYFNGALDFLLFEPLARVYRVVVPDPAKAAFARAFSNLSLPIVFANDLLQLEMDRAGNTLGRFLVNSTLGVVGLFDVASELGIEGHSSDFGQTLQSYGLDDGIYLVLPIFGPTTARDGLGLGVDSLIDPKTWLLSTTERLWLGAGQGVVRREQLLDPVDFLVEKAEDHYEAVRAWNFQQRQRELYPDCARPTTTICPGYGQ